MRPSACALPTCNLGFLGRQRFSTLPRQKKAATEAAETQTPIETTAPMTEAATEKKTTSKKGTPVEPARVLQIASEMEGQPADVVAKECGYYTEITNNATGETEVRVTAADTSAFLAALLAAKGVNLAPPARAARRSNRSPIVKIGKNGNIVVGGRHTTIAGFPFGEEVDSRVRIEAEKGKITIFAASPDEYASDETEMEPELDGLDTEGDDLDL
jgi:hypothetical protein